METKAGSLPGSARNSNMPRNDSRSRAHTPRPPAVPVMLLSISAGRSRRRSAWRATRTLMRGSSARTAFDAIPRAASSITAGWCGRTSRRDFLSWARMPPRTARDATSRAEGNLQYVNISTDCESCHLAEYNATTNPPHQAAGFRRLPVVPYADHLARHQHFAFDHGRTDSR